jgi:hypothetical protein
MNVFLHETLDPVPRPGAHTRYLDELGHVVETEGNAKGSAGGRCIAAWVPVFLTGRWPQIVTFWQMPGGWDGFGAHFDATPDLFHEPLERWYDERSGGLDRVLIGADYAPDLDRIVTERWRAPVVLQETVSLAPGAVEDYLDALGSTARELDPSDGVQLVGGYEVAFRRGSEALVLWAFDDFATLARTRRDPQAHAGLARWSERARNLERAHTGVVLRPTDWSPLR